MFELWDLDKCIIGAEMKIGPCVFCTTFRSSNLQHHCMKCVIHACFQRCALTGSICSGVLRVVSRLRVYTYRLLTPAVNPLDQRNSSGSITYGMATSHLCSCICLTPVTEAPMRRRAIRYGAMVLKRAIMLAQSCLLGIMTKKSMRTPGQTTFPLQAAMPASFILCSLTTCAAFSLALVLGHCVSQNLTGSSDLGTSLRGIGAVLPSAVCVGCCSAA